MLYCFPLVYMIYIVIRKIKMKDLQNAIVGAAWLQALLVFFLATFFNPYMNAAIGISCYSLAISCFAVIDIGDGREFLISTKAGNESENFKVHIAEPTQKRKRKL